MHATSPIQNFSGESKRKGDAEISDATGVVLTGRDGIPVIQPGQFDIFFQPGKRSTTCHDDAPRDAAGLARSAKQMERLV